MIEQFRDWEPKGSMSVSYVDGSRQKQVWQALQGELLDRILVIINEYQEAGIKLSQRQLYYRLVAAGFIPNAQEVYKRVCKFVTDARYGGYIDWDAIEDRGRSASMNPEWDTPAELVESAVAQYRLPRWQDQKFHVELYVEKEAMESVLQPLASKYHIRFGANKGYSSASMMYELAGRLKEKIKAGKECVVLYLGDHDSSGKDMVRDIKDRITEFLKYGEERVDPDFELVNVALTTEQVKHYRPPPNPAKALALDTALPTPYGWTTIKDVRIGDQLFSDDGTICKVISKSAIFNDKRCYEFTFSGGEKIVSSDDHLWQVTARRRVGGILSTNQIANSWKEGKLNRPVYRVHTCQPLSLPEKKLLIPPYSLGVWLGDGYSEGYSLACCLNDTEILNHIENEGYKTKRYDKINCGISGLCKHLRALDLQKNKHIPLVYLRASYNQRLSLLQGLMDTDGTVAKPAYRRKNHHSVACTFCSCNKRIAEQVLELVNSLGIRGRISESRAVLNKKDYGSAWRIEFYPDDIEIFRLKRKQERLQGVSSNIRQRYRTIINVREVESVQTQCIFVDSKHHLFLAGKQMIPTHNTSDPRAASYIARYGNKSWELDALEPKVLVSLTEQAIQRYLHVDKYNAWLKKEQVQKVQLRKLAKEVR
jgi:hypothetical protein